MLTFLLLLTFAFISGSFLSVSWRHVSSIWFPFFLSLRFIMIQNVFGMSREHQIYSMLISPVHAQSKSSLHSDGLKSSQHTDWSNFPPQFLLLVHSSCKCDNVLCSEIHTISVHLAPNVSKNACVLLWMSSRFGGEWLISKSGPWQKEPNGEKLSDSLSSTVQSLSLLYSTNAKLTLPMTLVALKGVHGGRSTLTSSDLFENPE